VQLLIGLGAEPKAVSKDNETAFSVAQDIEGDFGARDTADKSRYDRVSDILSRATKR
jgi:hypothetical protein